MKLLRPYLFLVILFLLSGLFFNTVETISFCKTQDVAFFTILQSFFNIIAVFCLYSLFILPFYLLLSLLKQKTAQIFVSILFTLLTALEIGLYMYYKQTGVLMGAELVVRPISEILTTIRNSSNITLNIISILSLSAFFIFIPFLFGKVKIFNKPLSIVISFVVIGIFSACTFFYQRYEKQTTNNYLESKSFYFFTVLGNAINEEFETDYSIIDKKISVEKNEELLREFVKYYSHKSASDIDYPMERPASEFPDVLSPYFKKSEKQPNIVIIIVEGLGNIYMGDKGNNVSFTPYLDSLANAGLFWKNCLSTATRTYAVVPSVIGSVPHGIKGFQFGIMPHHHSLFSILNQNNYSTNFYYGGDLSFDSMFDFISAQEPDHIDNFLPNMRNYKKKEQANWWGLYDHVLFEESINHLKLSKKRPTANVYLTLSTHEPFSKNHKNLATYYETKADKLYSKLNTEQQKRFLPAKDLIAVYLYIDDCIKKYINEYLKHIDSENTIFIITGDHSVKVFKNILSNYPTPLIIWSPLLKKTQSFPNIVSHLSVTPSLISYLQHNHNLKVPDKLAWNSLGLDTSSMFNPSEKILFLSYNRKVDEMVYNQYYFIERADNKQLYEINEELDLQAIDDKLLIEKLHSKFKLLKYVNNYVYHNDKLIKTDSHTDTKYKLIRTHQNNDTIICKTPDTIPSIAGINYYDIMPEKTIRGKYSKIKIKLMANIIINDYVFQDKQMMLNITCSGNDFNYVFSDHITKYIAVDNVLCNKEYSLWVEREINVKNVNDIAVRIYVSSNEYSKYWEPDKKITLSNMEVLIWGK